MTGKHIGYKRVSTNEQNPDSQLIGIDLDKCFVDIETGYTTKNRQQLKNLMDYVREDDIVYIECMDRLGRNEHDLDKIVEYLLSNSVQITFVREGIVLGKKNDPLSKLAYGIMKSFIHFFSQLAKERQKIGIEKAKREGKYKGNKSKFTRDMQEKILVAFNSSRKSKCKMAQELKIGRATLYKYMKQMGIDTNIDTLKEAQ